MRRATWASIRAHLPRLVAVSIAIILAVAFMSATLILNSSSKATLRESLGQQYANADLVITDTSDSSLEYSGDEQPADYADQVSAVAGVNSVYTARTGYFTTSIRQGEYFALTAIAPEPFRTLELAEGTIPTSTTEAIVTAETARQYEVSLGDQVTVQGVSAADVTDSSLGALADGDGSDEPSPSLTMTIVGVADASRDPNSSGTAGFVVTDGALDALDPDGFSTYSGVTQVAVDAGADLGEVTDAISALLPGWLVAEAPDQVVTDQLASLTGGTDVLTVVLLVFVGIALLVCGLVIANTFAVLVSQRTRELALLRCLGASRSQVYRSVLAEAAIVALVASGLGVLLAVGLMSGLVLVASASGTAAGDLAVLSISPSAVVWPILVGIAVTVVAAIGPARQATRVAPLQAMRPAESVTVETTGGKARLGVGIALTVIGLGMLVVSSVVPAVLAPDGIGGAAVGTFLLAFVGALVCVVGVIMLAVFYVPAAIRLVGRVVARLFGVTGKLATLNSVRNGKRTAATATALLIGVGLVVTILSAGQVARATLFGAVDEGAPIDVSVSAGSDSAGFTEAEIDQASGIDGVTAVVQASYAPISVVGVSMVTADEPISGVIGVSPDDLAQVYRGDAEGLQDGVALVADADENASIELESDAGTTQEFSAQPGGVSGYVILTADDLAELGSTQSGPMLLLRLDDGLSSSQVLDIQAELAELFPSSSLSGSAVMRAMFGQIIDTLLLIVTGLLAVAVVIALIGVSNTLSLSVIERTRENAMLRAIGLTRGQLRGMLAVEALLISGIAAVLGTLLGITCGVLGAVAIFNAMGGIVVDVPWLWLLVVIGVSLGAGLVASIGPARRAARLSPIEGLATT